MSRIHSAHEKSLRFLSGCSPAAQAPVQASHEVVVTKTSPFPYGDRHMSFQAPVKDILFNIEHLARIDEDVATLPGYEDKGLETAQMVL